MRTAASVGNRAPPHGGGASGGVLSSASDDDGGFQARCASSSKTVPAGLRNYGQRRRDSQPGIEILAMESGYGLDVIAR
jgi:hypothetical protein